jgi:non-specific serine/threonine protein kinase
VIGSDFAGYRIEELAERGGMGVIYRATQVGLGRTVALKVVTPALARDASFRERFRREWMVAASIDHPNVIPVYEAGEEDGILFIAMRWVEGTSLRDQIDGGPMEPPRAAHLVSQVASALDAAHERDLIHRDIKPANILITGQDHVYLTDFGLTKHASSISSLTKTGQWMGTVDYTAPEQIEGTTVTPATDVYSLGCVLFEALTGRAPYDRENDLATLWAHVYAPPPSLRDVDADAPAALDEVVQQAMSKDPAKRYESAGEFGRAAVAAARGEVAPGPPRVTAAPARRTPAPARSDRAPSTASERRDPWRPNRRAVYGLGGLLAALAAVAAIVLIAGSGSDQPETDRTGAIPSARLKAASAWRRLPPMPTPRQNMGSTVLDGTIWVVGGLGGGSIGQRRVEGYDPVVNGWKVGPDLPVRLHHEMVVTYKGELVVMGGWEPQRSDPAGRLSDRVFVLRDGEWATLPSLNHPRAAGAAAVVGDQIVVVGGQDGRRLVGPTEVFDGERWTVKTNIPTPREHVAAASDGRFVYAVGGRALSSDKNTAALERYDPGRDKWVRLADMPTARGGLAAAIADGNLFAIGGERPTTVLGDIESYNIASGTWSTVADMRTPRHGGTAAAIGRTLYSLGGAPRPGHASASATSEVLRLNR